MVNGAEKLPASLQKILSPLRQIAVAYSGGIDSRFLCHAALLCGCDVLAIHATGPHIAEQDSAYASSWAKKNRLHYLEIATNPLTVDAVANNTRQRCYYCKQALLKTIRAKLEELGRTEYVLCDGSNADDAHQYRPGTRAVAEAGIISPLALAGMEKKDIRRAAAESGLEFADQQARPCLLTRFAYGLKADSATLHDLAAAEADIGALLVDKKRKINFRLRLLPQPVLHIDAPAPDLEQKMLDIAGHYGFVGCGLEVVSKISGYFDARHTLSEAAS